MNILDKINFDKAKTEEFYNNYNEVCNCDYCKNFCYTINNEYPELVKFLNELGIIADRPIEAIDYSWFDNTKRYYEVFYCVSGNLMEDFKINLDGVDILFANDLNLYNTGMKKPYFLINISNLKLTWILENVPED